MKKIYLLLLISLFTSGTYAQFLSLKDTAYNHWSFDVGVGLTKPHNVLAPGFDTATPDRLSGDFGIRYMFNEYAGLRLGLGFNNFSNSNSTPDFSTQEYRLDMQGVMNMGRILRFETWTKSLNLLAHAGFGLGRLQYDLNSSNDHVGNAILGFTGQLKVSPKLTLNLDGTTLLNVRQSYTFDGTQTVNKESFIFNSTVGVSYYLGKRKEHADWYLREDDYKAVMNERLAVMQRKMQEERDGDAEKAREEMDKLNQRIDGLNSEFNDQLAKLSDSISMNNSDLIAQLVNEGFVTIYFDFNSSKIDRNALNAIMILRTYLQKNEGANVDLIGYADELGAEEYNKKLSAKRAEAVADLLVKSGINKSRLHTEGRGEDSSVDKTSSEARQLVRRVVFKLR